MMVFHGMVVTETKRRSFNPSRESGKRTQFLPLARV